MSTEILLAVIAALGAMGGTYGVYRANKRINSGTVKTSDAASLWTESAALRTGLKESLERADAVNTEVSNKLDIANVKLDHAIERITQLLHEVEVSHAVADKARSEAESYRGELSQLKLDIAAVHSEVVTGNNLTLGALGDNIESRRIAQIPVSDRTDSEREHVRQVGIQSTTGKKAPPAPKEKS